MAAGNVAATPRSAPRTSVIIAGIALVADVLTLGTFVASALHLAPNEFFPRLLLGFDLSVGVLVITALITVYVWLAIAWYLAATRLSHVPKTKRRSRLGRICCVSVLSSSLVILPVYLVWLLALYLVFSSYFPNNLSWYFDVLDSRVYVWPARGSVALVALAGVALVPTLAYFSVKGLLEMLEMTD